jgi:hypothetical protein
VGLAEGFPLTDLDQQQLRLAQRFGAELRGEQAATEVAAFRQVELLPDVRGPAARAAFPGGVSSLAVQAQFKDASTPEWITSAAALVALCAGAWLFSCAVNAESMARWFPLFCSVAGLAWWIWLLPGAVGLAMVAVGAWLTFRPGWRVLPPNERSASTAALRR